MPGPALEFRMDYLIQVSQWPYQHLIDTAHVTILSENRELGVELPL